MTSKLAYELYLGLEGTSIFFSVVGFGALIGAPPTAVLARWRHAASQGQVRYYGELWSAVSEQQLTVGERARIVGFDGLRLVVRGLDDSQHRRET